MSDEIAFKKDELSYVGENLRVLSWNTLPKEQSIVHIGKYCSLACNITFYVDGNHRYNHATTFPFYELGYCTDNIANKSSWGKGAPKVGHDVWIGNDATIMSGVTLGHGCVVGAKSLVTKSIPPYAIVGGNPAVILKYRFEEDVRLALLASEWWNLPKEVVVKELAPLQFDVGSFLKKVQEIKKSCT
jgi:acetyltransferase-like isoleucine patch superfamily enzyme